MLVHVAESGDKVYTVRCGGTRTMSVTNIREICEIADKYCDGHVRWTTRNNIEFMVTDEATLKALKEDLAAPAFPTSCTPKAGCTATPPPPTPPARLRL